MKTKDKIDQEYWEEMASILSREDNNRFEMPGSLPDGKEKEMLNYLIEMKNSGGKDKEVVDNAWERLLNRLENENLINNAPDRSFRLPVLVRIAAMIVIVVGLGITGKMVISDRLNPAMKVVATSQTEKNIRVNLSDGSTVMLNRNSEISYPARFSGKERKVTLKGEAFFEITPDSKRPFLIDAGEACVKVLGTSFNVMTDNGNSEVEVLVATGKVLVTSSDGSREITLEPGNVGTVSNNAISKSENRDPNYMWNSEVLIYNGDPLEKTFSDLLRVHNMNIVLSDEDIAQKRFTSVIDSQAPDTIITMICKTFNLKYEKSGEVYYISGK